METEAARDFERVWLLRVQRPDLKILADFRRDNRAPFQPLFKQFNLLRGSLEIFGAELVAIDDAKFKASTLREPAPAAHYECAEKFSRSRYCRRL
jgi:hypothetical protein